jgi:hypothetical protein
LIQAFKQNSGFASEILMAVMLELLMEEMYQVRRLDGFKWHDRRTKFHKDWFRHLSNITVITATIGEAVILVSLIEGIYEVRRLDCFMWRDKLNTFHEDWWRRSIILRFCLNNSRDFLITPLRKAQVL